MMSHAVNPLHDDDEAGEDRIRAVRTGGGTQLTENPLYSTQAVGTFWRVSCIRCASSMHCVCPLSQPDRLDMHFIPRRLAHVSLHGGPLYHALSERTTKGYLGRHPAAPTSAELTPFPG